MSESAPIDYEKFGQLVAKLVSGLSTAVKVQLAKSKIEPSNFGSEDMERFVGYAWGLCDVMAQHVGFKTSTQVSQGLYSGVMNILLNASPEQALALLEKHASRQGDEFIRGVHAGGEDAGLMREGNPNLPGFTACFGPPTAG